MAFEHIEGHNFDNPEFLAIPMPANGTESSLSTALGRLARGVYDEAVDPYITQEMKERVENLRDNNG